jgi:hypothetical protein
MSSVVYKQLSEPLEMQGNQYSEQISTQELHNVVQRPFQNYCDIQGHSDVRNRKQCVVEICVNSKTKSAYNTAVLFYSRIFANYLVILIDLNILISCVCPETTPYLLLRTKTHASPTVGIMLLLFDTEYWQRYLPHT